MNGWSWTTVLEISAAIILAGLIISVL